MKTKKYPVPPPKKGWRWLVEERTTKGDRYFRDTGKSHVLNPADLNYHTEGPRVWHHEGTLTFTVSGYARRIKSHAHP